MSTFPCIQILNKQDFTEQHIVKLPKEELPELASDSIRVRTTLFSLTVNNITYARVGHLVGWWDVHPLPSSIPSQFNNSTKYGRISCWGTAEVVDSTSALVPQGKKIYGYLPIGTLPVDLKVGTAQVKDQFWAINEHRKHLLKTYNRYFIYPDEDIAQEESQAWDAVLKALFKISYILNRFSFAWEDIHPIHPSGDATLKWTKEDANLKDAIVLIFAPAGKTLAALAQQIRKTRPAESQPRKLIGIGSEASKSLSEGMGWYDEILLYSDDPPAQVERWKLDESTKVVIFDGGSRGNAGVAWHDNLKPLCKNMKFIRIASEVVALSPEEMKATMRAAAERGELRANASVLLDGAIGVLGEERYWVDLETAFSQFKQDGTIPGVNIIMGEGMSSVENGWNRLAKGEVPASEALVFKI
jgi:hypothetical protein